MGNIKVICLSGWKSSGKDTCADYLVSHLGCKRIAFADPLKDNVAQQYDIPRSHCDDPAFKETPIAKYSVNPTDKFSKAIVDIIFPELRTIEGKPSAHVSFTSSQLHNETLYYTPRSLCILEGSTKRSVASNHWVTRAINKIIFDDNVKSTTYVISDLRYKSELEQLRTMFGDKLLTIRVNRFDTNPSTDASETDLDNAKFDIVITNKSTLEDLYSNLEDALVNA